MSLLLKGTVVPQLQRPSTKGTQNKQEDSDSTVGETSKACLQPEKVRYQWWCHNMSIYKNITTLLQDNAVYSKSVMLNSLYGMPILG